MLKTFLNLIGPHCATVLGLLFLYAGIGKTINFNIAVVKVPFLLNYPEVRHWMLAGVIGAELVVGFALLFTKWMKAAVLSSACMLVFFFALSVYYAAWTTASPCGCFGYSWLDGADKTPWFPVMRNALLVAIAACALGDVKANMDAPSLAS